jgi:uncharacterized membrane protein (UPF0127 family)
MYLIIGEHHIKNFLCAITEEEQAKGLMGYKYPTPIMLFPYKEKQKRSFYMKNCNFPLDVIFCCDGKIVSIMQGKPNNEIPFGPNKQIDCVIEVPCGFCDLYKIKIGDKIRYKLNKDLMKKLFAC